MGTLGRKVRLAEAKDKYSEFREHIIPFHCQYGIDNITVSGSIRRLKDNDIGDIDVIITTISGEFDPAFVDYLSLKGYMIDASGSKLIRMLTSDGVQFDLYAASEENFYCMMSYLTGPLDFNVGMRVVAKKLGYKLNQNELLRLKDATVIHPRSEEELFRYLNCKYISPENRINFYHSLKCNKLG